MPSRRTYYSVIRERPLLFLVILLGTVFLFFTLERLFVFGLITLISGVFSFYHAKLNRTPVDLKMALFLGIIITRYYGLKYTFVFVVISDIIPTLISGGSISGSTPIFYTWFFIVNALVLPFQGVDIVILGIILVIVESLGSVFINSLFGIPIFLSILSSALNVLVRIVYFLTLGRLLQVVFSVLGI